MESTGTLVVTPMTFIDLKAIKEQTENEMKELILRFESMTGLEVEEVRIGKKKQVRIITDF